MTIFKKLKTQKLKAPTITGNEINRLMASRPPNFLDTPSDIRFDRVARLAQRLFAVPTALVSLVDADRQWRKYRQGVEVEKTPREIAFCGHAILGGIDQFKQINDQFGQR